ncbi:hypothetical protein MNBD_GAMMA11-525 [hydrothermal vent metagenome]|uniref:Ricin B lectin domain-containing protein n=1 Tax=hydrothermal vent metagenome TaxID=652676 RepID=A0A3B0XA37_9ZZZZ
MSEYYYIVSKLNGFVLDITGQSKAPVTPVINYPINKPATSNQLWQRVPTGPKDPAGGQSQYYIKSKLNGFVLDIKGRNTGKATPIISFPENSPASTNQIWQIEESDIEGYFYITSLLNGYVIDVFGQKKTPGTAAISYPKNVPVTDNQLWQFILAASDTPSHKKSAFANT